MVLVILATFVLRDPQLQDLIQHMVGSALQGSTALLAQLFHSHVIQEPITMQVVKQLVRYVQEAFIVVAIQQVPKSALLALSVHQEQVMLRTNHVLKEHLTT